MKDLTGAYTVHFRIPRNLNNKRTHDWLSKLVGPYASCGTPFQNEQPGIDFFTVEEVAYSLERARAIFNEIPAPFCPFMMLCALDAFKESPEDKGRDRLPVKVAA